MARPAIRFSVVIGGVWATSEALAHSGGIASHPLIELGGLWGGLLHPLVVPAHLAAVLGLGILIGQQNWSRLVPAAYVLAVLAGLGVLTTGVSPHWAGVALVVMMTATGGVIAVARPWPEWAGVIVAVLTGFALALDSPPEALSLRQASLKLIGTGLGAALLLVVVAELSSRLTRDWQRAAARILGAGIAILGVWILAEHIAH